MPFMTFADGSANLPNFLQEGIRLLPCNYTVDGEPRVYDGNLDAFDIRGYYDLLRSGRVIKTSLLNAQCFLPAFSEALKKGLDVIYVSMSSGISGTFQAARIAAEELMSEFPGRLVHIVDSKTCGLGTGLQAVRSAELNAQGVDARDASRILDSEVEHACSYFTVDDLNFLKRTGRVSGATAAIGSMLNIKPILFGNSEGHIVSCAKVRGRKNAIARLAEIYREKAVEPENKTVYISHGDCAEDAQLLSEKICGIRKPAKMVICPHEPFSGAHVGPGMLGLFFCGSTR